MNSQTRRVACKWPAAPGNAATILLFSTHPKLVGSLVGTAAGAVTIQADFDGRSQGISGNQLAAVEFVFLENDQASNANGIRLYALKKDGTTWREVDLKDDLGVASIGAASPRQVPVIATPAEYRLLIDTSRYVGVAVEYTAGATGPSAWDGNIMAQLNTEALMR